MVIPLAHPFTVLIQILICLVPSIRLILVQLGIFQFRKKIDRTFWFLVRAEANSERPYKERYCIIFGVYGRWIYGFMEEGSVMFYNAEIMWLNSP